MHTDEFVQRKTKKKTKIVPIHYLFSDVSSWLQLKSKVTQGEAEQCSDTVQRYKCPLRRRDLKPNLVATVSVNMTDFPGLSALLCLFTCSYSRVVT